jgi:hypothetical protein
MTVYFSLSYLFACIEQNRFQKNPPSPPPLTPPHAPPLLATAHHLSCTDEPPARPDSAPSPTAASAPEHSHRAREPLLTSARAP